MYLDHVPLWPDDSCITAETCFLEVNYKFYLIVDVICCVLDGNKIKYYYEFLFTSVCSLKLFVSLGMAYPKPKHVVLLNKMGF